MIKKNSNKIKRRVIKHFNKVIKKTQNNINLPVLVNL